MEYYTTMNDLGGSGIIQFVQSIALATPGLFSFFILLFWVFGSAVTYYAILKTSGKKRFFHALTGYSLVSLLLSLLFASMNNLNDTSITILSGYWVGFYVLATLFSWWGLSEYK